MKQQTSFSDWAKHQISLSSWTKQQISFSDWMKMSHQLVSPLSNNLNSSDYPAQGNGCDIVAKKNDPQQSDEGDTSALRNQKNADEGCTAYNFTRVLSLSC